MEKLNVSDDNDNKEVYPNSDNNNTPNNMPPPNGIYFTGYGIFCCRCLKDRIVTVDSNTFRIKNEEFTPFIYFY